MKLLELVIYLALMVVGMVLITRITTIPSYDEVKAYSLKSHVFAWIMKNRYTGGRVVIQRKKPSGKIVMDVCRDFGVYKEFSKWSIRTITTPKGNPISYNMRLVETAGSVSVGSVEVTFCPVTGNINVNTGEGK